MVQIRKYEISKLSFLNKENCEGKTYKLETLKYGWVMTSYKGSPKDILKSLVIISPGGGRGSWRIL